MLMQMKLRWPGCGSRRVCVSAKDHAKQPVENNQCAVILISMINTNRVSNTAFFFSFALDV